MQPQDIRWKQHIKKVFKHPVEFIKGFSCNDPGQQGLRNEVGSKIAAAEFAQGRGKLAAVTFSATGGIHSKALPAQNLQQIFIRGGVCFCCVWASSCFGLSSLSLALACFFFF